MRTIDADACEPYFYEHLDDNAMAGALNAISEMPTIEPQQRWIPCSKELPERNLVVLVTTRWGEVTEGVKLSGDAWFIGRGEENAFDSDILAWMPKPEPYKAERRTDGV